MENNENKKEEVLETEEVVKKDMEIVWVATAGLVGIGTAYMLGMRKGLREGFAVGHVMAVNDMVKALTHYSDEIIKNITTKGD